MNMQIKDQQHFSDSSSSIGKDESAKTAGDTTITGSLEKSFPIVCVGGSAGGLDAYIRLLQNLPADLGVAIVIVNHMRTMPTQLHEILPKYTSMPVDLITDNLSIEPNRVFIIPANRDLHVVDGEFRLKPISKPRGWPDLNIIFANDASKYQHVDAPCAETIAAIC